MVGIYTYYYYQSTPTTIWWFKTGNKWVRYLDRKTLEFGFSAYNKKTETFDVATKGTSRVFIGFEEVLKKQEEILKKMEEYMERQRREEKKAREGNKI